MPITCPITVRPIIQEEFRQIDYRVMRCAFDSRNELGRLCDEVICQNDLANRLRAAGVGGVCQEVPLTVSHRDFSKTYRLDLVIENGAIYELKTEARLAGDHDAQLLNYLFLCGAQHGKLVNFRPAQIESKFINTTLNTPERKKFVVDTKRWRETDEPSQKLRQNFLDMLEDWGAFLDLTLYTEALTHFLGGEENVMKMVPLRREGVVLGNQRIQMAGPDTGFRLTALPDTAKLYEPHLQSLLHLSPLRSFHWINMARHQITLATLVK